MFVELALICYMMITFRSRQWPEYFSLDILYRQLGNGDDDNERMPKSMIMTAVLPPKWIISNDKPDIVLNGREINYLKKQKFHDPQLVLLLETAEQDNWSLQKMNQHDFN